MRIRDPGSGNILVRDRCSMYKAYALLLSKMLRLVGPVVKEREIIHTIKHVFSLQLREEDTKFLQEERQAFELELRSYSGKKPHIFIFESSMDWTSLNSYAFKTSQPDFRLKEKNLLHIFFPPLSFCRPIMTFQRCQESNAESCLTT
jgi:hypothetical protein